MGIVYLTNGFIQVGLITGVQIMTIFLLNGVPYGPFENADLAAGELKRLGYKRVGDSNAFSLDGIHIDARVLRVENPATL